MKVQLTYFKPNGKYYARGEYETQVRSLALTWPVGVMAPPLYEISKEVAQLKGRRRLPGLNPGHSDFHVLIDVPDHPHNHPHMIPVWDQKPRKLNVQDEDKQTDNDTPKNPTLSTGVETLCDLAYVISSSVLAEQCPGMTVKDHLDICEAISNETRRALNGEAV